MGLKIKWFASVLGTCHVELDELLKLNNTKSKIIPKRILDELVFYLFIRMDQVSKCLLGDPLFDQSDANRIKRKKYGRRSIMKKGFSLRWALPVFTKTRST